MKNQSLLRAESIVKVFPGVLAVDNVDFELRPGEVHMLIGENGAGKSTLIKTFLGVHRPTAGTIYLDGKEIQPSNTREAFLSGIAAVFQEFNLIPVLNVAQNIYLGREPIGKKSPFIDENAMHAAARALLDSINLEIDTFSKVESLGVAQQQMVEIARALSMNARVLIFDEPTACLTKREIEQLFLQIEKLKARDVGIIYISHRLEEVFQLGDRVTVLRDGRKIGTWDIDELNMPTLVNAVVGREIDQMFPRDFQEPGEVVLSVSNLNQGCLLKDISLTVRTGEIVGIAGLVGSGRTELLRAIFGVDRADSGKINVRNDSYHLRKMSPTRAVQDGIAMVPESRKEDGLALGLPLQENVVMASLRKLFPRYRVSEKKLSEVAQQYVEYLSISCRSIQQTTGSLSGGTQQKVVVSKWLASGAKLLLFDEPTRGIDVGSKADIHSLMNDLVKERAAILMVSSELPELLSMCDRMYVMRDGQIVADVDRHNFSQEEILSHMMGG